MRSERFGTVWDALYPVSPNAKIMRMRSELMSDVVKFIKADQLTRSQASRLLCLEKSQVSDLLLGKLGSFNLEALIRLSERCGQSIELRKTRAS